MSAAMMNAISNLADCIELPRVVISDVDLIILAAERIKELEELLRGAQGTIERLEGQLESARDDVHELIDAERAL